MPHIPSYLTSVSRGDTDWPSSCSELEQEAILEMVKDAFAQANCHLSLEDISRYSNKGAVKQKYSGRAPTFYGAVLWDYHYACLERACRAVAMQVWVVTGDE